MLRPIVQLYQITDKNRIANGCLPTNFTQKTIKVMRRLRLKLVLLLSLIPLIGFCQENEGPTMGWSSWNTYRVNISDSLIMRQADAMVSTGLNKFGYKYMSPL
jgi:hypothetical protein